VLAFERGEPAAWDGERLAPVALVERVEACAAAFGIGRGIHLGETILGLKGRVAFEAPAAEVLLTAHRELEKLVLTARQQRLKDQVAAVYGELVHEGRRSNRPRATPRRCSPPARRGSPARSTCCCGRARSSSRESNRPSR